MGMWWLIGVGSVAAAELGLTIGADGASVVGVGHPTLSLDVEALPLHDFVAMVVAQTGVALVVLADGGQDVAVTAHMVGVPWDIAVTAALAPAGLGLEARGAGWGIVPLP